MTESMDVHGSVWRTVTAQMCVIMSSMQSLYVGKQCYCLENAVMYCTVRYVTVEYRTFTAMTRYHQLLLQWSATEKKKESALDKDVLCFGYFITYRSVASAWFNAQQLKSCFTPLTSWAKNSKIQFKYTDTQQAWWSLHLFKVVRSSREARGWGVDI